jgi:hypothetical protein
MVANARLAGQAGLNFLANGGAKKVAQAGLLRGAAGAVAAPLTGALMAGGAALNFGDRLMKGENIVQAAGNTAYDTADFATFGLLKPTVGALGGLGQSLSNTVFGESDEDKINRLTQRVQESEASGNYGGAMVANQELQQVMSSMRGRGSQQPMMQEYGQGVAQQDYTMGLENQRFGNELDQQQQLFEQQFANSNRTAESAFDRQRRAANIALNNSYYSDAWKTNQGIRSGNAGSINRMNEMGLQLMGQAMSQRY